MFLHDEEATSKHNICEKPQLVLNTIGWDWPKTNNKNPKKSSEKMF